MLCFLRVFKYNYSFDNETEDNQYLLLNKSFAASHKKKKGLKYNHFNNFMNGSKPTRILDQNIKYEALFS